MKTSKNKLVMYGVIGVGATALITGVLIYNHRKKLKVEYAELLDYINKDINVTGSSLDLSFKGNAFDPQLWRKNQSCPSLPIDVVRSYATSIYNAKGRVYDDEQKVVGVFRQINKKCDVSRLADVFQQMYKTDMYLYLKSFMENTKYETNYLEVVYDLVKQMS